MDHRHIPNLPAKECTLATIAFHAINGTGTGHLARQTALAEHLRFEHPRLAAVILSSSSAVKDICGAVPAVNLPRQRPSLASVDPIWGALNDLADQISADALRRLHPAVLVHDTTARSVLQRTAAEIGSRQAFCLRPRRHLANYLASSDCPLYEMDLVFVPDVPACHPEMATLLDEAGIAALWTGPIFRGVTQDRDVTRAELGVAPSAALLVVMSGGGHGLDSHQHIANCLRALARVEHPSLDVVLVLGPLFTPSLRIPPGFPHQVTVLSRSSRLPNLLSAADVVLCRGGYGSLHEATAGGAAVLATPAERTWDDQERRIEQFATAGLCEWGVNADPAVLSGQIDRTLQEALTRPRGARTAAPKERLRELGERLKKLALNP